MKKLEDLFTGFPEGFHVNVAGKGWEYFDTNPIMDDILAAESLKAQSAKWSMIETASGTAFAFVTSMLLQWWLYPLFGWEVTWDKNLEVTLVFTVVSLVRSYYWRRLFNWYHTKVGGLNV